MGKKIQLELAIPQSLSDIKLEQYQKYVKVLDGIDKEAEEAGDFINLKALEIFCGLQLKECNTQADYDQIRGKEALLDLLSNFQFPVYLHYTVRDDYRSDNHDIYSKKGYELA